MVTTRLTSSDIPGLVNILRSDPFLLGFDQVFDRLVSSGIGSASTATYPPYNIVKNGEDTFAIEIALAGYGKKDITVDYAGGLLNIKSIKEDKAQTDNVLHQGISKRFFSKTFTIADDVEVHGAALKDGLLKVSLEKILPEGKKPRTIEIK